MAFAKYPYSGMDFQGDPDLMLLVGVQWSVIGKLIDQSVFAFKFSTFFCVFLLLPKLNKHFLYVCKCWICSTYGTPARGRCASIESCWDSSSPRLGFSKDIGPTIGSHREFNPRYSGCLDRGVTYAIVAPYHWRAESLDDNPTHDSTGCDLLS